MEDASPEDVDAAKLKARTALLNLQNVDFTATAKESAQDALFQALVEDASLEELETAKSKAKNALVKMFTSADDREEEDITPEEMEQAKLKAQDAVRKVLLGNSEGPDMLEHVKQMTRDALLTALMPAIDAHSELAPEEREAAKDRARDSLEKNLYGEDKTGPPADQQTMVQKVKATLELSRNLLSQSNSALQDELETLGRSLAQLEEERTSLHNSRASSKQL